MGFATKWKTKKLCAKEWSKRHIFLSHFFIFHRKPKRMLNFFRNGFWIVLVQKVRKKCLSHSGKMHFSVSGHMTLGVVRWRHELDYLCPLWVLSKFDSIEAYMCRVIANWFFPSNGIKRYFKVISLKLFYYQTFFETWQNEHSWYEHYKNAIKIWGHRACLRVSRLLKWGVFTGLR